MVRLAGIEPARTRREILSLLCLPIPPQSRLINLQSCKTFDEVLRAHSLRRNEVQALE